MKFRLIIYKALLLLLACNYFVFRTELFDDEHEQNSPKSYSGNSISDYSLNWETFDKDNAPKAFTINTEIRIQLLCVLRIHIQIDRESYQPFQLIRDKSPPPTIFS